VLIFGGGRELAALVGAIPALAVDLASRALV
jgi:hypothetical protein